MPGKFKLITLLLFLAFLATEGSSSKAQGLIFKQNKGQWPAPILYAASLPEGDVYFLKDGLLFDICDIPEDLVQKGESHQRPSVMNCHRFKLNFNSEITENDVFARSVVPTRYNILVGDPENWATNIKGFGELVYQEIKNGISIRFYSEGNLLKYDVLVREGADISELKLSYSGIDAISIENNQLQITTSVGQLVENIPVAYFKPSDRPANITYRLEGQTVHFEMQDSLKKGEELVIDPILVFSTYSGATADNWGSTATYDQFGNLYSGGISNDLPSYLTIAGIFLTTEGAYQRTNNGEWDVAITKYDSLGSKQIYSTLLGGTSDELVQSLVVNSEGQLVIMGVTSSIDFPKSLNAFQKDFGGGVDPDFVLGGVPFNNGSDIFITVLSEDGSSLVGSTLLGGTNNDGIMLTGEPLTFNYGDHSRGDIYTDEEDNIYIASKTRSIDFPMKNAVVDTLTGELDAVVAMLNADVSELIWSTYLGGTEYDAAYSIKKNDSGQVIVAGGTNSPDFHPDALNAYSDAVDGWVGIIEQGGGTLSAIRYVGTLAYDQAYFTDLDPYGNIYLFGQTAGQYPVQGEVFQSGGGQFIHKFSPDLETSLLSTRFGRVTNGPDISPTAFLVNDCGNIYVSGWGGRTNDNYGGGGTDGLPVTNDAYQTLAFGNDFYLAVFIDDMAELLYATFLGGEESATHVDGGTSRFDPKGIVYHAVCAGCRTTSQTGNSDFPTTEGAWSRTNNSSNCNNAAFKFDLSSLRAGLRTNTPQYDNPGVGFVCRPDSIVLENTSVGGEIFEWDFGDGQKLVTTDDSDQVHEYLAPGNYRVKLKIIDYSTCSEVDSTFTNVTVYEPKISLPDGGDICEGDSYQLNTTGAHSVIWELADGTFISNELSFSASPKDTTQYFVEARYEECILTDSLWINVLPNEPPETISDRECSLDRVFRFEGKADERYNAYWEFGDGNRSHTTDTVHTYSEDGQFNALFVTEFEFCRFEKVIPLDVVEMNVPNMITPEILDSKNDKFEIVGVEEPQIQIFNRWGRNVYASEAYRNDWSAENVEGGTYYYILTTKGGTECRGWLQVIK